MDTIRTRWSNLHPDTREWIGIILLLPFTLAGCVILFVGVLLLSGIGGFVVFGGIDYALHLAAEGGGYGWAGGIAAAVTLWVILSVIGFFVEG